MYTSSNFKPFSSNVSLAKSRSTDNFYRRAAERSMMHSPAPNGVEGDCLACKHEKQTSFGRTSKQSFAMAPAKTSRKIVNEQYYKTSQVDQLTHVKKTKRYLEQLLEKTKADFKRSVDLFQRRLAELSEELKVKNDAISELKQQQNLKEAEQYYLANASLVQTYQQSQLKNEEADNLQAKKIRDLTRRSEELSDQLSQVYKMAAQKQNKIESLEMQMTRMKQNEISTKEYEAMRGLISKMEEDKLRMLDRQHSQLQQFQTMNIQDKSIQQTKILELQGLLEVKTRQLQGKQIEMQALKGNLSRYRDQQYQTLRQLMDEREKECLELESKINCVEAELNFVKGRYGYLLRMVQTDQISDSRFNDPDEICIERVGRYQVSNGKESLLGMNMSPIKRR